MTLGLVVLCALEVALFMEVALVMVVVLLRVEIKIGKIIYYYSMLWLGVPFNKEILSRKVRATVNVGRPVFRAGPLLYFLNAFVFALCTLKPRKHQPELNTSLINPASEHCVVVTRARNRGSTTNIYCRNIDNSGSGVGKPFQLRRSENTSFWTNEDVENEGIKVGCVLEYRVLTCYQSPLGRYCKLGKRDGKQFIFHRNDRKPLLVSFH